MGADRVASTGIRSTFAPFALGEVPISDSLLSCSSLRRRSFRRAAETRPMSTQDDGNARPSLLAGGNSSNRHSIYLRYWSCTVRYGQHDAEEAARPMPTRIAGVPLRRRPSIRRSPSHQQPCRRSAIPIRRSTPPTLPFSSLLARPSPMFGAQGQGCVTTWEGVRRSSR
jgi:hypothetical protein